MYFPLTQRALQYEPFNNLLAYFSHSFQCFFHVQQVRTMSVVKHVIYREYL